MNTEEMNKEFKNELMMLKRDAIKGDLLATLAYNIASLNPVVAKQEFIGQMESEKSEDGNDKKT